MEKYLIMNKIKIKLPEKKKFLIVGSGDPVKTFIKKLRYHFNDASIFVISDRQCDRAWSICEPKSIELVAKKNNSSIEFPEDINKQEIMDKIKKIGCNICFVLGSRWIFQKKFIDIFNGNIFNYHTSDLPYYQGGGGYRWQIMNQEKYIYIAFHQITEDIDRGSILAVYKKRFKKNNIYPKDIFEELYKFTLKYFDIFFKKLKRNTEVTLIPQNQSKATYFPLLDNNENGAIDLNWSKHEIRYFINAFSYPYKGAFLFYKGRKIFIKEAKISNKKDKFHPFVIGLIINKTKEFLEVVVNNGRILFKEFCDEENTKLPISFFKLGDRFYMPNDILLKAKIYRPHNKKFILQVSNKNN